MARLQSLRQDRSAILAFAEAVAALYHHAILPGDRSAATLACGCAVRLERDRRVRWAAAHRATKPASEALARAGVAIEIRLPGIDRTFTVNPAEEWETLESSSPLFSLDELLACCFQAVGNLEHQAAKRERRWRRRGLAALRWSASALVTLALGVAVIALGHILRINN